MKNAHLEGGPFLWEAGPTGILLVHGYTATTAEVRPLAQALHARGYTVSGPVLPGHNSNPVDINKYSWRDWVAVVEEAYHVLFTRCDQVFLGRLPRPLNIRPSTLTDILTCYLLFQGRLQLCPAPSLLPLQKQNQLHR